MTAKLCQNFYIHLCYKPQFIIAEILGHLKIVITSLLYTEGFVNFSSSRKEKERERECELAGIPAADACFAYTYTTV